MSEFILVKFDESREVIIDGSPSGYNTGEVIGIDDGLHTITLEPPEDFIPKKKEINPSGTSPIQPEIIYFYKE